MKIIQLGTMKAAIFTKHSKISRWRRVGQRILSIYLSWTSTFLSKIFKHCIHRHSVSFILLTPSINTLTNLIPSPRSSRWAIQAANAFLLMHGLEDKGGIRSRAGAKQSKCLRKFVSVSYHDGLGHSTRRVNSVDVVGKEGGGRRRRDIQFELSDVLA